ncbi:Stk1 family PASTA domain-containing Ser/Thr kinase [Nocardioides sp.]|uniref:Stk1 family PASTA domain-containing Ser/Thr kinase n=1 Tax=Nocardioides sp. TaxID=35761 RepID=UPI003D0EB9A6
MDVDAQGPSREDRRDGRVADPLIGRVLEGRYRIGPRIARGGMASVYEATDIRLDRTVAVKIMHPGLGDDEEFAARFVREARAAARLSHPNVVGVFDQGTDQGTVFLAMEYVPGHTLRDVIRKEAPMSPTRAMSLIDPVLSALAAAHRAGLIHRDIKPENVLIADDGRIKVADFGLAKAVSTDTQHTATGGVLIGTVSYLAPELVIDGTSDARADVYAAGVVLYEMLTGHKPHEGESPIAVAYKHVHEDVPAPSAEVPGLPAYVDALVARGTSRDRNNRPADAGVYLHQVHRVRQALAEGVQDDPELTADLMPLPSADPVDDEIAYVPEDLSESTLERIPALPEHTVTLASTGPATPAPGRTAVPVAAGSITTLPRKRSRRGIILFLVALLLATGAGVGAWWFGSGRYTPTPSVIGLTEAAATSKIEAEGLQAKVGERVYSESVAKGQVMSTDPDPGANVLDGGTVTMVVSLGKERYDVPKLRGKTEDQAQDAILAANLSFGRSIGQYSEKLPEGTVIGSDPKAGLSVKPDTAVDLILSKGPRPIKIRDFTGRSADRAESVLSGLGLVVNRSEEYNDSVPEGRVISQDPDSGTLFKGDDVTLVVSQGPELVEIPGGLIASGVESARTTLEDLGFRVDVKQSDNSLGLGFVYSVSPGQGEMVPKGSTITLYLI